MISPIRTAVPDGASTLLRWCASMISMSTLSPSERAATSRSLKQRLTPTLMLGACTMGMSPAAFSTMESCSGVRPVVPMTIARRCARHVPACSTVGSGRVKSMHASETARARSRELPMVTPISPMPATVPASAPTRGASSRSTAAATDTPVSAWTVCTSILPIRPAAPTIVIGIVSAPGFSLATVKF